MLNMINFTLISLPPISVWQLPFPLSTVNCKCILGIVVPAKRLVFQLRHYFNIHNKLNKEQPKYIWIVSRMFIFYFCIIILPNKLPENNILDKLSL